MPTLAFYISGHGFGHASRDIEVLNALAARRPDVRVVVRTTVAPWLFDLTMRGAFEYARVECDTGIVQIDGLRLDVADTLRRARAFMAELPARAAAEADALTAIGASLVVYDIPALGSAAAARAGLPAVALGNFSWDWAYAAYDGAADVAEAVADAYRPTALALRLPMQGGFEAFSRVEDVPFIARRSARAAVETRAALGLSRDERVVLTSFGGHGVVDMNLDALAALDGYAVLVSGSIPFGVAGETLLAGGRRGRIVPFDETSLYAQGIRYEDLVAAADVVVTKPGFGIIAECVANDTAMVYTSRGHFAEYDVMVREMPRVLRCHYLDQADFFAGRWREALDAVLDQPPPPDHPAVNGAEIVAERLVEWMEKI
ncbi:MAG: hypothetical protein Q8L86_09870 [Vicinamibacterales bacterium]|nr:hypothetical protein [Vicinamibacterales bacterium]